mmetsp:Transcript_39255/g.34934  ORF Transcript_39255/g.34934 Transcript_39255/m.34934 type:complete len:85 (-) Transcript_39255:585-839(-)
MTTQQPNNNLVQPVKLLNSSRFEVYLAQNQDGSKQYAMKFFPHPSPNKLNESYLTEKAMTHISHPNIIKVAATKDCQQTIRKGQ